MNYKEKDRLSLLFSKSYREISGLGPEAILSGRTVGVAVGGGLITYKWMRESRALPQDGYHRLAEQPAQGGNRCWDRFRNCLFGRRDGNVQGQQPQRLGCNIM